MKIDLTPDQAAWVEAELAAGHFASAEDAIGYAINEAKRAALKALLEESMGRGGNNSADDALRHVRERFDEFEGIEGAR